MEIKVIKKIIIVFSIVFLFSCIGCMRYDIITKYTQLLSQFDKNLTTHFPSEESLKKQDIYVLGGGAEELPMEIILGVYYDSVNYELLKKKIKEESCNIISGNDSNIITLQIVLYNEVSKYVVYGPYKSESLGEMAFKRNLENTSSDVVIPIFNSDLNTFSGLLEDDTIYHIETKIGKFHNLKPFEDPEIKQLQSMPNRLKEGYSRGYTLNDKQKFIRYWLVIW